MNNGTKVNLMIRKKSGLAYTAVEECIKAQRPIVAMLQYMLIVLSTMKS